MRKVCSLSPLLLLLTLQLSGVQAHKRFQDVMKHGQHSNPAGHHHRLQGWSPESNHWNEKLYPAWDDGDSRWNNCWKGGKVVARLTSDSPALIGSNVTFVVTLQFPRCQKEDENGDIVYDKNCKNDSSVYPGQYVYNWTEWLNCTDWVQCSNTTENVFPDGRPFPHHHKWRRNNFIYVFYTLGQYYQQTGGSWTTLSLNTTNITIGTQLMAVSVYRRGRTQHTPVAKSSGIYVVTDQIPFYVNISQKNDRNASDGIFIKDSPIMFDVRIHDPSKYLNTSAISYKWNFGDGSGSFVSNNPLISHTYTLLGNFSLNLTVKAAVPGPCHPVTPTPAVPTVTIPTTRNTTAANASILPTTPVSPEAEDSCLIYRYGYYNTTITIVEGILEVNIIQMTNIQVPTAEFENSMVDFVISCQGSIPTDACTTIADPLCMVTQNVVCDKVTASDQCLLTLRRSFSEPGTYCVNITLNDDASLALASTLVSVNGVAGGTRTVQGVLIAVGFLVVLAIAIAVLLHKRYREYKPVERSVNNEVNGGGVSVYFNRVKAVFFPGNNEKDPLLKNKARII
ncbi:transmembrane glycoprotein NMB [Rhinatrema bivittatum]|uniref:transmembrane glycoprotein NMB n=1 Tax=Rhinatrema bivittatum TaxID=194408 RepID=UPI00112C4CDA|nr:transmembrane glycoprotein NMB [Rhinatrema bivittatum]